MKIKVNDMMCDHCVKTIAKALEKSAIEATVDLTEKSVDVAETDYQAAKEIIVKAGYTAD